ncbi:MAG TPA: hypothetical protein VK338_02235, partial [Candidatus Nitrosocosmicus sp.]|nr:hypothetical protein [Candidatus Nitrosocosmicus sp.]
QIIFSTSYHLAMLINSEREFQERNQEKHRDVSRQTSTIYTHTNHTIYYLDLDNLLQHNFIQNN